MSLTFGHDHHAPLHRRQLDCCTGSWAEAFRDADLRSHLERWGELHHQPQRLIDELDASGLVGHGGAWFPVAAKWRAVAGASRRRPVVVANGAEGEPASRKDALAAREGAAPRTRRIGARGQHACAPDRPSSTPRPRAFPTLEAAVAERRSCGLDPIAIDLVESPDTFISGQESAVVNAIAGRR